MPHVDELIGRPAAVLVAGLVAAVVMQAAGSLASNNASPPAPAPERRVVKLPPVEVVARRSDGMTIAARDRKPRIAKPAA